MEELSANRNGEIEHQNPINFRALAPHDVRGMTSEREAWLDGYGIFSRAPFAPDCRTSPACNEPINQAKSETTGMSAENWWVPLF